MKELSAKKHKAIFAMLEQPSMQKAAECVGISETTLYRWLADSDFKNELRVTKQRIVSHAISRLQRASGKAVDALVEIITDKDKPPSTRVSASRAVLELVNKFVETEDLQFRLDEIEKILKRQGYAK